MTAGLQIENISVIFRVRRRHAWPWRPPSRLRAVSNVSLSLLEGETLGIVGESGSGKSTLAKAIVGIVRTSTGTIMWRGQKLSQMSAHQRRASAKDVQMVFQDPLAALNPRMTIGDIIEEPLRTHCPRMKRNERQKHILEMLERVGLHASHIKRYPHEFSGGQCQRAAIARALVLKPKLLICDEAVSALDVSVRAQIINLLTSLQREFKLSMIFIAHDLSVVQHVSDRIAVMYLGHLIEEGPSREVVQQPRHPYTQALIESVPDPSVGRLRRQKLLRGEIPSPLNPPSGCVFRTRCMMARPACGDEMPPMIPISDQRRVACPYSVEDAVRRHTQP